LSFRSQAEGWLEEGPEESGGGKFGSLNTTTLDGACVHRVSEIATNLEVNAIFKRISDYLLIKSDHAGLAMV
jgi:hypothetical protein